MRPSLYSGNLYQTWRPEPAFWVTAESRLRASASLASCRSCVSCNFLPCSHLHYQVNYSQIPSWPCPPNIYTAGGSRNANSADSAMLSKRNIRSKLKKSTFKYTTDQDYSSSLSAGCGDLCLSSLSSGSRSQKMASSRLGYVCKVSKNKHTKKNPSGCFPQKSF